MRAIILVLLLACAAWRDCPWILYRVERGGPFVRYVYVDRFATWEACFAQQVAGYECWQDRGI